MQTFHRFMDKNAGAVLEWYDKLISLERSKFPKTAVCAPLHQRFRRLLQVRGRGWTDLPCLMQS